MPEFGRSESQCYVVGDKRKGEVWSAREGSQTMEVVMVVIRMDG